MERASFHSDVLMAFDDLPHTQEVYTPSPVPRGAEIGWQMPPSSNPGLQTLIENVNSGDSHRTNPSRSESHWNVPLPPPQVSPPALPALKSKQNSRAVNRSHERRRVNASDTKVNASLAQLTSGDYMLNVASVAEQKAKERSREMGLSPLSPLKRVKGKVNHGAVIRAGKVKASRGSSSMSNDTGSRRKSDRKVERKGNGETTSTAVASGYLRDDSSPFHDSASTSTSSSLSPITPENSTDFAMVVDTPSETEPRVTHPSGCRSSVTGSFVHQPPFEYESKHPTNTPVVPALSVNVSASKHRTGTPDPNPTKAPPPRTKHHPLPQRDEKTAPPTQTRRASIKMEPPKEIPHLMQSSIIQASGSSSSAAAPAPPSSFPRSSTNPPPLGMRRAATLPGLRKNTASSAETMENARPAQALPTRRRPFKTPFIAGKQPPGDGGAASASTSRRKGTSATATTRVSSSTTIQSDAPQASTSAVAFGGPSKLRKTGSDSEDETSNEEGDTSYGDLSLEMDVDALEATMKEYD